MSWQLLDYDVSTASLGGWKGAEEIFGLRPVTPVGVSTLNDRSSGKPVSHGFSFIYGNMFEAINHRENHPFFGTQDSGERLWVPNDVAREWELEGVIIDSVSTMASQELDNIKVRKYGDINAKLLQDDWGVFKSTMMRMWKTLKDTDVTVICTCHVKRAKDDQSRVVEEPDIAGSSATEMLRFFDGVIYTRITRGKNGERHYKWQLQPDERRYAKIRSKPGYDFPAMIDQDFEHLFKIFADMGVGTPKILIIGESGTGKTRSLATIGRYNPDVHTPEKEEEAVAV